MKCDMEACLEEPTVFIIDNRMIDSPIRIRPGQIINCNDPGSFKKYCLYHWEQQKGPFSK